MAPTAEDLSKPLAPKVCAKRFSSPRSVQSRALAAAVMLAATGCSQLPRDPAGTIERIETSHQLVVGEIDGARPSPRAQAVLRSAAGQLGARVVRRSGDGEALLEALEKGQLDIVYGRFAMSSPWSQNVHFGRPLGRREIVGRDERVPRFAFRHGENGWIMLVERTTR